MASVLIADDSASNRELLRTVLEHAGMTVLEAADGLEAVEVAKRELPGLILLDIQMPKADGFAALALLRQEPTLAAVPIIALTAFAMGGDRERGLAAGFSEYITKPVGMRRLLTLLEQFRPA